MSSDFSSASFYDTCVLVHTVLSPPSHVNRRCVPLAKKSKEPKHERSLGLKAASETSCVIYSVEDKAPCDPDT